MEFFTSTLVNILTICITIVSSNKCEGVHVEVESTLFSDVVKSDAFVDKTMFLVEYFQEPSLSLITAPRGFGKSTLLNMLKSFLSIEIGAWEAPTERREAKNYLLFKTKKLEVFEKEYGFFASYFGTYPVISVDFNANGSSVTSYGDALRICKQKIHASYKEHAYLINSIRLTDDEKKWCQLWTDEKTYQNVIEHEVRWALCNLSQFLNKHFNRKVFVLVDDYDNMIMQAVFGVKNSLGLKKIVNLTSDILTNVLNDNPVLENGLLTGVFKLSDVILANVGDLWWYGFLNDHPFSDYVGFTKEEVDKLFNNTKFVDLDRNGIGGAHATYGGYQTLSGRQVYCPYSVVRFLQTCVVENYWTKSRPPEELRFFSDEFFKVRNVSSLVCTMLQGEPAVIDFLEDISVKDIVELKRVVAEKRFESKADVGLYFSLLFQLGYLGFVEPLNVDDVNFPTKEVDQVFAIIMSHH